MLSDAHRKTTVFAIHAAHFSMLLSWHIFNDCILGEHDRSLKSEILNFVDMT